MPSIKDNNYRLPEIEPLQKHDRFVNSANKPLLITGIDIKSLVKGDFVVKLMKSERMSGEAAMRELLAAFIAMELELPVAQPAVILISDEFVELLKGEEEYLSACQSIGFNFGTKYQDKFQVLAINQKLPNTLTDLSWEIFVFDVLINNADRSFEIPKKPNLLTNGKEIFIFDHETSFGFIFDLSFNRNNEPWVIRDSDKLWMEKHCLFRSLKGNTFDDQNLLHKFARLDNQFWERAWGLIPVPWRNEEHFNLIKEYLGKIIDNKTSFLKNIEILLV